MVKIAAPEPHLNKELYLKALVYGQPGVGKTALSGTAVQHAAMRNVLFLTIEGGLLSVPSNENIFKREIRNGFDPETGESVGAFARVEAYFWALADRSPEGLERNPWVRDIRTVVIDSGTELLTLSLEQIVTEANIKDPSKHAVDDIHLADYGKSTASLKRIFRWYRDLPYNFIMTALSKNVYASDVAANRSAEPIAVIPSFTEKLGLSVQGYFDHVWYMYKDDADKRFLLTRTVKGYVGKTRGQNFSNAIGQVVENPNLAELYDRLLATEMPAKKGK